MLESSSARSAAQAGYDHVHVVNRVNSNTGAGVQITAGASPRTPAIDNEGKKLPDLATLRYVLPGGQAGATLDNSISSIVGVATSGCLRRGAAGS
ncbi:hypothetical protein [Umezawaea beigongshangensis]|uniref:hypothetical protein n=1 Tax=Umezawaea beigongshangensis TaxID=2780383 RepID=UPI0018F14D15|nr:hypothetical protein [Umezawaea beigongshangensis]